MQDTAVKLCLATKPSKMFDFSQVLHPPRGLLKYTRGNALYSAGATIQVA